MKNKLAALVVAFGLAGVTAVAQQPIHLADLADLSLEQLSNITVSSASRRAEPVLEAPASIYVVTAEDIRRSGAVTLYDALALAPNLLVVRGDASQAITSARGGIFGTANKMLVLIDGRTIYTPLFAGVFSDAQDLVLEDIERIEVISGPGSTLWGTNAVNGVINVTTKTAARTQGALVSVLGGSEHREATFRYGGSLAQGGFYRAYAKYGRRTAHELESGASALDASERWQAGFRMDWEGGTATSTVQGDAYAANVGNVGGPRDVSGANLRGQRTWKLAGGSEMLLQAYYDHTQREHQGSFRESRDTLDAQFQHALAHGARNRFVWGGEYRISSDSTFNTPSLGFMPNDRVLRFPSVYVQEELALSEKLRATLGVRAERNDYTGVEWLPNVRLAHASSPSQLLWLALTRTVRAPSRIDRELVVPGMPPYLVVPGNMQAEVANVAEAGIRRRISPRASVSLTAFHHRFQDLRTAEFVGSNVQFTNAGKGRLSGVEGWGDLAVHRDWRLVAGFTRMRTQFEVEPGHADLDQSGLGNNPRRTALLRSLWNVTPATELDVTIRHVGESPKPLVPSHTVADLRAGWRVARDLDVSLLVTNIFDKRHAEAGAAAARAVFERAALLRVTWTPF
jgi:iron complex outermembrane recepter protein